MEMGKVSAGQFILNKREAVSNVVPHS